MRRLALLFLSAAVFAAAAAPALAGDITRGEELAGVCVQCHGAAGAEPIANYPKIGGQYRKYLLYTMRAYKNGGRADPVMAAQMANFSDGEIADLAAYFAAQEGGLE